MATTVVQAGGRVRMPDNPTPKSKKREVELDFSTSR